MQAPTTGIQTGADVAPQIKTPTVTVFTDGGNQQLVIPQNHDEMMGLMMQRRQLNEQLDQVTERRDNIIEQLRTAPDPAQKGLQDELTVLNSRVIQIQTQLATVGSEISQASPALMAMAEERPTPRGDDQFDDGVGAGVAGSVAVMSVFFFFAYRWWRKSMRKRAPLMISADSERLQRLEQGMEAVAIEIERISEGQRFVTKLLSESRTADPAPR